MTTTEAVAPTWDYKGTTITLNVERATFNATIGKRRFNAPSLDAMKRKLDEQREFGGFTAYVEMTTSYASREIENGAVEVARVTSTRSIDGRVLLRIEVIGFDRKEREYLIANGRKLAYVPYIADGDEEAFIARWKSLWDARTRRDERVKQLDAEINEIQQQLKTRSPREEL